MTCSEQFYRQQLQDQSHLEKQLTNNKFIRQASALINKKSNSNIMSAIDDESSLNNLQTILDSLETEQDIDNLDPETIRALVSKLNLKEDFIFTPWYRSFDHSALQTIDTDENQSQNDMTATGKLDLTFNIIQVLMCYINYLFYFNDDPIDPLLIQKNISCLNHNNTLLENTDQVLSSLTSVIKEKKAQHFILSEIIYVVENKLIGTCLHKLCIILLANRETRRSGKKVSYYLEYYKTWITRKKIDLMLQDITQSMSRLS